MKESIVDEAAVTRLLEDDTPSPDNLVLHGTWTGTTFFLWAESGTPAPKPRGRRPKLPPHPFSAEPDVLRAALDDVLEDTSPGGITTTAFGLHLPTLGDLPLLPPWLQTGEEDSSTLSRDLAPWRVKGLALDILTALDLLVTLPVTGISRRWARDLRYWSAAAKLGLEILARQSYLPGLREEQGAYRAIWSPVLDRPEDVVRVRALTSGMPAVSRAWFDPKSIPDPAQAPPPGELLSSFLESLVDRAVRDWGAKQLNKRRAATKGAAGAWWEALWAPDGQMLMTAQERHGITALHDAVQTWLAQVRSTGEAPFRLCFRLEPPQVNEDTGAIIKHAWTLNYLLQARDDPSLLLPLEKVWQTRNNTLETLNYRFEHAQERVLAGLGMAARLFPPVLRSLKTAQPRSCELTADEAYAFLREVGPLLESSGFGVLVPPWWSKPARLGVRAHIKAEPGTTGKGILTLDSLVAFEWELALGEETLTREEFERLVALKTPLVQVRGQWVLLQVEEIEAAITFWEKQHRRQATLRDALALTLNTSAEIDELPILTVEVSGAMEALLEDLQAGEDVTAIPVPTGFQGQLRPYQLRGSSWLSFMRRWGLGACLADDMGLGKTIQAITLMLHVRERAHNPGRVPPALLVCPTSVVGNWKRELARFAPELQAMVHHGSDREQGDAFNESAGKHDIVITTYAMMRRDVDTLSRVQWSDVILDEAQNIKNPNAKQTQAARRLQAENRVALTGTPVENRLSELWSIMQFLNPGFLGPQTRFRESYALPIERYQDIEATKRLRKLVGPFILRRLKSDPTIIQDLPDKQEMKVYCSLTPEQVTLYQAVVQKSLLDLENTEQETKEPMSRRGAILSALLRLKQVCNHPAQYLDDGSDLPRRSGKLERITEMLEEVLAVGDRALIFTQFAGMGKLLHAYLRTLFGVEVLYLHGGTRAEQRDQMVARFQSNQGPPIFLLSLKAGGTGLNLTAANHVFHFDRWWNPAVEDQATDRAYRIGQTQNVQVHKLICSGTLEEKIDALIESKKSLAQSVVSGGEEWLTELSTDQLRELITLREE
jgi:SNF2 family DNA or RNA helicase